MFTVYILKSLKDKRTYIGYSKNFKNRLEQHNKGKVKSTKYRRPFVLIYKEEFKDYKEAKSRELWWKSYRGRQEMRKLF